MTANEASGRRWMFPIWNLIRGVLLAPLVPVALYIIVGFINSLIVPGISSLEALGHALFMFVYVTIACYAILIIFAFPLYLLGWVFLRVSLFACLFFGALIGGALLLGPFVLQYTSHWPMWDSESQGHTMLIIHGKFTTAGVVNSLAGGAESAIFGAAIAFAFWWIAIKDNPPAQSRRLQHG